MTDSKLQREPLVEKAIIWAEQQGYYMASDAANSYAEKRGLIWAVEQAYYNLYGFFTQEELDHRDKIMADRRAKHKANKLKSVGS